MADRKEDIAVRISADYGPALANINRFVNEATQRFERLPKAIQASTTAMNALSARSVKAQAEVAGTITAVDRGMNTLPNVIQNVTNSIDRLTQRIDRMGSSDGPERLRRNIRDANTEATRFSRTLDGIVTTGKIAGAAFAGFQAGKMVLMPQVEKQMEYSTQLAHTANVAYSDVSSVAGRQKGKAELNQAVIDANRYGGGTRDMALAALNAMTASGAVTTEQAKYMLPTIVRGSSAANAKPEEIAGIAIKGLQNFGFKKEDLPDVIDMALKSANLGGFEVKDMARWLPQQMGEASTLGYRGKKGFAQLLSLNQAAITTAASPDMAGNNVSNLLAKINSSDTKADFKKLGIDLTGSLTAGVGNGIDPLTSFSMLIDGVMKKDKAYQVLEAKLKASGNTKERTEILEQQIMLQGGNAIGRVLQDRQARGAYLAYRTQGAAITRMTEQVENGSRGLTDTNYALVSSEPGFKRQQALNEEQTAQTVALSKLNPALESYYERIVRVAKQYPALTAVFEGGKIAVTSLGAAAGATSVVMLLLRRNAAQAAAALGNVRGAGAAGAGGGAGAGAAGAAGLVSRFARGLKIAAPLAVMAGGLDAYDIYQDDTKSAKEKKIGYVGVAGGAAGGALGGAAAGAALGSVVPGVGTVIGGVIGGGLGYFGGRAAGTSLGEQIFDSPAVQKQRADPPLTPEMQRVLASAYAAPPIDARLKLDLSFDDTGRPYVRQQSLTGTGLRIDTGPMMTH